MSRFRRKGRNMGPVDEWLDSLGYYRKNVAYDETCLFRAISEQMFSCQLYHEKIRKECINYAELNFKEFAHLVNKEDDWLEYLEKLSKHMAICGRNELEIISRTFKKGVLLFDGINRCVKDGINETYDDCFLLCHMGEDHYDVVYKKEYIQDSGFCQSLVYKTLYEKVFNIGRVDDIVEVMLYQKPHPASSEDENNNNTTTIGKLERSSIYENNATVTYREVDEAKPLNDYEYMMKTHIAPFPFKVAKALDPNIYRNIEYDNWTEMRKEMRLGEWYYGDSNLIRGSACILSDRGGELKCYIQDILENSKCVIYITSRAEKRTVEMKDLRPEEDAKPWPLPYRFSKNLVLTIPKVEVPERKPLHKKREKKNIKINIETEPPQENTENGVNAYKGAPLQMQTDASTSSYERETLSNEQMSNQQKYYDWDTKNGTTTGVTTDTITWSQGVLNSPTEYNVENVSTAQQTDNTYYYTNENYPSYNIWPNGEYVAPLPEQSMNSPQTVEVPENFNFYFSDGSNYSPGYSAAMTPYSPQVEMYPPVFHSAPPGTPVILAPAEMTEMVMQTPPHIPVYSPVPMEVPSYIPTSPYIYPPLSPVWYPFNSSGFIFPTVSQPNPAYNVPQTNN